MGFLAQKGEKMKRERYTIRKEGYSSTGARAESAFLSRARSRPSGQGRPGHIPQST